MKSEIIRIGKGTRYDKKYMDGRIDMRVLVLQGTPEDVLLASELRRCRLNRTAVMMYDYYTTHFSVKQLDELFADSHADNLKELIRQAVISQNIYLLSLFSAEVILSAEQKKLL